VTVAAAKKKTKGSVKAADMSAAVEPTVRTFTTWTPDKLRAAYIQADGGDLRPAANLCDWLLTDDRVSSTLRTRVQTLLGLEPSFERSGDKRRSTRAVKALEGDEDWWEAYPESTLADLVTWGLLLGVKPARHRWEEKADHDGRILPMPEGWHPQHLRYDNSRRVWRIRVAPAGSQVEEERDLVPGDSEWILHTPFGPNRPWSMGLWRALAPLVLLKAFAQQDWANISERSVLLVLTCMNAGAAKELEGYTKDARKELAEKVYARGKSAVAALPPGVDLKAIQAAVSAKDVQGALITMCNDAIAITVRGGNLTTEVKDGSRAATETQAQFGDQGNLEFDAQSLTTTIHDQSLTWWAEFNFGDSSLAPWPVYPVEPEEDLKAKVEADEKAFANCQKAEQLGFEVDRKEFLEQHKITWAKPGTPKEPPQTTTAAPVPPGTKPPAPTGQPQPNGNGTESGTQARAIASATQATAAGDGLPSAGARNGLDYSDRLTDETTATASKALAPTVAAMLTEVARAESYDDARSRVEKRFGELLSPVELKEVTESALILGNLAGHAAVRQDTPELEE
jgi:phage gp29-like protein